MSEGIEYRALGDLAPAQQLFGFAAAAIPPAADVHLAWGAWLPGEQRLVGALLMEREGPSAMLYGPVVVATVDVGVRGAAEGEPSEASIPVRGAAEGEPSEASIPVRGAAESEPSEASIPVRGAAEGEPSEASIPAIASLDVAAQLVTGAIEESAARGVQTLFARPQGLDRIWIRYGFIPIPEGALPSALRRGPGAGLFAYRGGSALWTFRETASGARLAR